MRRSTFAGIALVAVVALALTAASVETLTLGSSPPVEGTTTPGEGGSSGCVSNAPGDPTGCADGDGADDDDGGGDPRPLSDTGGAAEQRSGGPALWQVVVGVALFTLGGVTVVYGLTRGDGTDPAQDGDGGSTNSTTADTASQRPAADVPPTNDVYRSWIALRDAVDTGTAAPSPAAVADAAVAAGFDEEAVESLTREFCVLRYGPAEVTAESEARARTLAGTLGIAVSADR